jgi:hypothetical protein
LVTLLFLLPGAALAAFPGTNPAESPRANTPNDPGFDPCEADDPNTTPPRCTSYFNEQFGSFGFSPDSANQIPLAPHAVGATQYANCSQLDGPGRAANVAAGDPECSQIAGIRADSAWKYSAGSRKVSVAVLDTGIRWQDPELVNQVRLNRAELPKPQVGNCDAYDCNGDGAFNIKDYTGDPRVDPAAGDTESDGILDASDLIATFSDGTDADANGYVDDIAGWDFFDDDNDPFDASSCCSANGHGTGRAKEAVAATNNGTGETGMCPRCQLMPLRMWDTFVAPTDNWAAAVTYAARNGADVAEGATGGLTNTQFARSAFRYADSKGMALMLVSSDINSANHNYPTNYNEAIYVAGSFPDTAPNETCSGPGGLPGIGDVINPPPGFEESCQQLLGILSGIGVNATAQPITTSFFRNSNLTQYGGKADIVLMGTTGSENTGQSAGVAALLESYARHRYAGTRFPAGVSGNETRQLLTMTAEDVLPQNTGLVGLPDKANGGWDPHFGYGRVNLAAAMKRIKDRRIPPEAQLDSPDWFAPINVARVGAGGVPVRGYAAAPHSSAGVGAWEVDYACGQDAVDSSFQPVPGAAGTGPVDGKLGVLSRGLLASLANTCNGEVTNDAGRPAGALADGPWPADPYPNPDPERHAFQIRFTVHEAGDASNFGRYRKTLFAYANDGNLPGWPRAVGRGSAPSKLVTGTGGETSPRLYDVNGDNALDVLLGTSSGELYALNADGSPVKSFNDGKPVLTEKTALARHHGLPRSLPPPRDPMRVPAIGDINGDRQAEIVATAGEHIYAWNLDGSRVSGFPVRLDPALSDPCQPGAPHPCFDAADRAITTQNHIKRGFFGSPALADLDDDGRLDIVASALDQHLYAFDGKGHPLDGWPVLLSSPDADGAEIVTSPAIADLDGDGKPEVVTATNEVIPGDPQLPSTPLDLLGQLLGASTGSNPVYAVHGDGSMVSDWPVHVGVAAGDLLPLVLPGHDAAVLDTNGDGSDEVSVSAGTGFGGRIVDGGGATVSSFQNVAANCPDQGPVINLADYPSLGDLSGDGSPDVLKGGGTVNLAVNLLAVNQNLPFCHVEQAWDPVTGLAVPGYPRATDDFQLVSQSSVARVAGSGPQHQALVGTGLYQLHAYGPAGAEPAGWPKFTGGWLEATPAVGDADGDGNLDVTDVTREGWAFLWSTNVPACSGSNNEWWTWHHDERGTANYGIDGRPPGVPTALKASRKAGGAVRLSWKAPGDDWSCGSPSHYQVITSPNRIRHPADGAVAAESNASDPVGSNVSVDIGQGNASWAAVLYRDEAGNWGLLRSVRLPGAGRPRGHCHHRIVGTAAADVLRGTPKSDRIRGGDGDDVLKGLAGDDCLSGGPGRDRLSGGMGDDVLRARGKGHDRLACGPGHDVARVGNADRVRADCETVRRGA